MKKHIALSLLLALSFSGFSQRNEDFADRLIFGGNANVSFGNITFIDISPTVIYKASDKHFPGAGLRYQYYRYRDDFIEYSWNLYGGTIFDRYFVADRIFAQAEYESLNIPYFDGLGAERRRWVGSAMVGGGLAFPFGMETNRSYMSIEAMYILNYDANTSIYGSPLVIRGGFTF